MLIYIAGPYSSDTPEAVLENVNTAIDAGVALAKMGHAPLIPHLNHWVAERHPEAFSWDEYMDWDLALLEACDALLYLGSSPGANIELDAAIRHDMRVFRSLDEVPSSAL